jgi:hypothetical protein
VVVAACLIVEAIIEKTGRNVTINIVAFLAPLWVFVASLAWPATTRSARSR